MSYTPTTWVNEVPTTTPVKYKVTDDSLGIVAGSAKIEVVSGITTTGTPVNATNLNKIENGIVAVETEAVAAAASAVSAASDAAAASALATALATARKPIIGKASATGETISWSGSGVVSSQLAVTLSLPATCTILAFLTVNLFNTDSTPNKENSLKLRIDGTLTNASYFFIGPVNGKGCISIVFCKTGVLAGSRTINVLGYSNTNPSQYQIGGDLTVMAFQE